MSKSIIQVLLLSLASCAQLLHAEAIKIPIGTQSPELNKMSRPTVGMTKARVKSHYGAPIKENAAVGKPPISNWEYASFIVYFEYDHVIDSVIKPIYHESTITVVKEIVVEKPAVKKPAEMPVEDLNLNAK